MESTDEAAPDTTEVSPEPAAADPLVVRNGAGGRLFVAAGGVEVPVTLRQCFPWYEPRRYLSLRDAEDREVALVVDPADFEAASRAALEQALAEAGFVLEVTRVLSVEEEVEIRQWQVETKDGRRNFQTRLDEWPLALPMGGLLIRDVAGDLYRLADPAHMDRKSRAVLWAFVD